MGSTHIPFAEALEEVVRTSGLSEDRAREALLTRPRHTEDPWRYHVHSYPLRETRPTPETAEGRARVLSAALPHGRSSVIEDETAVVLAEYERGDETYRDGDHAAGPASEVSEADELSLLGVDLYGYSDGVVGVSGADELDDCYSPLRLFPDHAPGTPERCVTRLAAVLFDDTRILPQTVDEGQQPWQAIRDLPHSWEAVPQTVVLVEADSASGTRRVRLFAV